MNSWFCDYAWTGGKVAADVVIRTDDGRVTEVTPGVVGPPDGTTHLRGLTLPAFANAHSHAFHRALRGRTHSVSDDGRGGAGQFSAAGHPAAPSRPALPGTGSFWTWREQMYCVAERLDPDSYHRLARALYAEMVLAGYGVVGEFHYLHHAPGGRQYADPNAMGEALIAAADDAGIRLTLLDTCYLTAGVDGEPLEGVQERFSDGDADAWATRVEALAGRAGSLARIGAAIHSVRAVPPSALGTVAQWATARDAPLHIHLSEQPRENEACLAAHGLSPAALLAEHGALTRRTTAVHATHLTDDDVALLASAGTRACVTRTTERDLADGAPDLTRMVGAGIGLCVGSDSNAVVDPFEEARGLELDERVRTLGRGHLGADALLHAGTAGGYASLGWAGRATEPSDAPGVAGRRAAGAAAATAGSDAAAAPRPPHGLGISVGDLADLTTIGLDSIRLAGWTRDTLLDHATFAATSSDVTDTVVGGRHIVRDGIHSSIANPAAALHHEIRALLDG